MTAQQFAGICRQCSGWINQCWGELSGDLLREDAGRHDRLAGKMQQRTALLNEQLDRQMREFLHRNRNWTY